MLVGTNVPGLAIYCLHFRIQSFIFMSTQSRSHAFAQGRGDLNQRDFIHFAQRCQPRGKYERPFYFGTSFDACKSMESAKWQGEEETWR